MQREGDDVNEHTVDTLSSLRFVVKPDDDKLFDHLEEGLAVHDGKGTIFVRESEWPRLKAELMTLPRRH